MSAWLTRPGCSSSGLRRKTVAREAERARATQRLVAARVALATAVASQGATASDIATARARVEHFAKVVVAENLLEERRLGFARVDDPDGL